MGCLSWMLGLLLGGTSRLFIESERLVRPFFFFFFSLFSFLIMWNDYDDTSSFPSLSC
jgi:hypothetical protein